MTALLAPPLPPRTTLRPRSSREPAQVALSAYMALVERAFLALIDPQSIDPRVAHGLAHVLASGLGWASSSGGREGSSSGSRGGSSSGGREGSSSGGREGSSSGGAERDLRDVGRLALVLGEGVIERWLDVTEALARVAGVSVHELRRSAFEGVEPTPAAEVEAIVSQAFGATAGEDLGIACADLDAVTDYSRPFLESLTEGKVQENAQALYQMTEHGSRAAFLVTAILRAAHDPELRQRADPKMVASLCDLARHDVLDVWRIFRSVFGAPE